MEKVIRIGAFDGQTVWLDRQKSIGLYDIGNYLGGGVAGTVYQCEDRRGGHFAMKILNPIGYKLLPAGLLRRCVVILKGQQAEDLHDYVLCMDNVWWLIHATTKQYIAAYFTQKHGLRELNLSQCVDVWGNDAALLEGLGDQIDVVDPRQGPRVYVPRVPPKYIEFLKRRQQIFREINNMSKIPPHRNVIALQKVLELNQDSKCTIFLIQELANGGELFDQIKIDHGTSEETARFYFLQVVEGVRHCHHQGVCHRDLKPENLLLCDMPNGKAVLKIADFGFSTRFADEEEDLQSMEASEGLSWEGRSSSSGNLDSSDLALTPDNASLGFHRTRLQIVQQSPLRILKSVVGSPFYVAPEVLSAEGYDGTKADTWSLGIILYAMLAGNLPFDQEISSCKRFKNFCAWTREVSTLSGGRKIWELEEGLEYPQWMFPARFSFSVRSLVVGLLHPDPSERMSVFEAKLHPWCCEEELTLKGVSDGRETACPDMDCDLPEEADTESFTMEEAFFAMEEDSDHRRSSADVPDHKAIEGEEDTSLDCNDSWQSGGALPSRKGSTEPPLAPLLTSFGPAASDLFNFEEEEESVPSSHRHQHSHHSGFFGHMCEDHSSGSEHSIAGNPPSFNEHVKRSTRFVTYVPASDVIDMMEHILEDCRFKRHPTPIGCIAKIEVFVDSFRIEVWSIDFSLSPICAIQLYQMPPDNSLHEQQSALSSKQRFLVEFVRGQIDIFPFKRFYQWLRHQLAEYIKQRRIGTPELNDKEISLLSYASPSLLLQQEIGNSTS